MLYKDVVKLVTMLVVELEDIPFTTPDYIFNLKSWMPRLYSCHRKGPDVKDEDISWDDYSYEPVETVTSSTTNGMPWFMLISTG